MCFACLNPFAIVWPFPAPHPPTHASVYTCICLRPCVLDYFFIRKTVIATMVYCVCIVKTVLSRRPRFRFFDGRIWRFFDAFSTFGETVTRRARKRARNSGFKMEKKIHFENQRVPSPETDLFVPCDEKSTRHVFGPTLLSRRGVHAIMKTFEIDFRRALLIRSETIETRTYCRSRIFERYDLLEFWETRFKRNAVVESASNGKSTAGGFIF